MAFDPAIESILGGATNVNNTVVIPDDGIVSYVSGNSSSELVYGLIQSLYATVASGDMTNLTATARDTVATVGSQQVLRKDFTFRVNLEYNGSDVGGILDVLDEPA